MDMTVTAISVPSSAKTTRPFEKVRVPVSVRGLFLVNSILFTSSPPFLLVGYATTITLYATFIKRVFVA